MNGKNIFLIMLALFLDVALSFPTWGADKFFLKLVKLPENQTVLSRPLMGGDRFYLDYTHSLDKTPIHDVFLVNLKGELILLEELYEWYGAGLAFHPEGKGRILFDEDWTRVLINRVYDPFYLRVGTIANHTLTVNSEKIPLLGIAKGRDLIAFSIERKPSRE